MNADRARVSRRLGCRSFSRPSLSPLHPACHQALALNGRRQWWGLRSFRPCAEKCGERVLPALSVCDPHGIPNPLTPLQMETASLDRDFGYETLCSMMDWNSSSSSSPSNGGCCGRAEEGEILRQGNLLTRRPQLQLNPERLRRLQTQRGQPAGVFDDL